MQFDTKVFQAEKVDFAGHEEYIYRGGRDKFKLLKDVSTCFEMKSENDDCCVQKNISCFIDQTAFRTAAELVCS